MAGEVEGARPRLPGRGEQSDGGTSWGGRMVALAVERPGEVAYRFLRDGREEPETLTWRELDRRTRLLASALRGAGVGERALLLCPPGLDYVTALFACLRGGIVAVPAYPPQRPRSLARVVALALDAEPLFVLTTAAVLKRIRTWKGEFPLPASARWIVVDRPLEGVGEGGEHEADPEVAPAPALLQYTSGSTGDPKGVVLSHANLLASSARIHERFGMARHRHVVSWLPPYHDMGLVGGLLQPLYAGVPATLFSPAAFLQSPVRWLEALSGVEGAVSGAPDFAFDLCVRRIPEERRAGLDLSGWAVAFSGAEPVRAGTLERFARAFASCGFRPEAFFPCYGLAEATLMVSGGDPGAGARVRSFAAAALERGRAEPEPEPGGRPLVGCGRAIGGHEVAIVDGAAGRRRPAGEVGEIWVRGEGVGQGYWRRPEESESSFRARLAGEEGAGGWLRTGDLGFLDEEELFITGRLKELILVRGRNLAPADLEHTAAGSHPALQPGGGAAFSFEERGEERVVVVAELEPRAAPKIAAEAAAAVRRAVAEEHGIALAEVVLVAAGQVPRTSSGKIRRGACRDLYRQGLLEPLAADRVEEPAPLLPPRLEAPAEERPAGRPEEREAWLLEYLCTLGGAAAGGRLDPELPPTAQGLDSLRSAELAARIEAGLGIPVGVDDVLAAPSVAALARILAGRSGTEQVSPPPWEAAAPEREGAPSAGQRALWSLARLAPRSSAYHIAAAARWLGPPPGSDELPAALRRLVGRHDALRTVFPAPGGEPARLVLGVGEAEADFAEVEAGGRSAAEVEALLAEEAARPFDLENGPLLRVRFYRGPDVLLLAVHHLVADLVSLQVLAEELGRALGGHPLPPPPAFTYGDYVRWQDEGPAGRGRPSLAAFWEREIAEVPQVLELPLDRPRPPVQVWDGGEERALLPAPLVARVAALARERRATLFAVLLAGFEAFLARASRQDRFLVGSPATGRTRAELAGLVGYLSNVLPLAADLTDAPPFAELVDRARDRLLGALAHQDLPFPLLAEGVLERRDPARPPLVQVTLSYQEGAGAAGKGLAAWAAGGGGSRVSLGGLAFETVPVERRGAAFDLMLTLAPAADGEGEGLAASLVFASALFDRVTARRWLAAWSALLAGAAGEGGADLPVSLLPWSLPAEARHLLAAEAVPHPAAAEVRGGLDERFAAAAARRPEAVAVTAGTAEDGEAVTYGELARRAGRLAGRLRLLGVGPEVRVGLCLERSAALIEGILGVLAAGGAYLPLDPSYPEERLLFLLEDAAPRVVVTRRELAGRLGGFPRLLFLGEGEGKGEPEAAGPGLPLERAAYVIYTSGSTGRPKGVVVSHANAVRLFDAARPFFAFGEDDVWSLCHSASFDFSVWEIGGALLHGGRLVVVPEDDVRSPAALLDRVVREGITVLSQTPSAFRQLARVEAAAARPEPWRLAWVTFGGEALDVPGLAPWFARRGGRQPRLVNLYGITETTVHVTCRPLGPRDAAGGPKSPVGEPLPDLVVRLLDRRLEPVPAGLPGEMAVGGAGVARGYLGRPELTAARFVPDPWGPAGSRLYLSGDLARRAPSGELVFLGRADQQVKVRGFRIEPGEIEAVLGRHPAVGECVVVVRPAAGTAVAAAPAAEPPAPSAAAGGVEVRDARLYLKGPSAVPAAAPGGAPAEGEGETRLVAYFVARPGHEVSPAALRAFVAERLPAPLVPAVVVPLARLPLTAHGKLDRRALPAPGGERPDLGVPYVPPATAAEEILAEAWGEVLGVGRVGLDDDYFALGGDSILALRLAARAGERGVRFEVADLFRNPTVRQLAARTGGPAINLEVGPGEPAAGSADGPAGSAATADPPLPWDPFPVPEGVEGVFPLSRMQAGLIFHSEQHPGSSVYRASFLYRFRGPFDPATLGRAADQLAARHGILRTSFDLTSFREPVQLVLRRASVPVEVRDLRGMPAAGQEEAVAAWFEEQVSRDFDWSHAPLLRLSLLRLEESLFDLGITCHDAILDGWSTSLLLDELLERYSAELDGGSLPVAAPPVSYRDFVALERRALASPADREFWRQYLAGAEPVPLPRRPLGTGRTDTGAPRLQVVDVPLSDALDAALQALAVRAGTSLKHVALAAHVRVLAAVTGTLDVITGLEANGRPERPGAERSAGQFLNTVPWRQRLVPGSWLDLVRETRDGERQMLPHRRFPYAEIQKGQGGRPLYESTFNYTHFHLFRGLERRSRLEVVAGRGRELTHYPLKTELNRHPWSGKLQLDVVFDGGQLTGAQARAVAELYLRTFERMATAPEARWETAPLLAEGERQQLLREWNDTAVPGFESAGSLAGLCEAQAARTPDAVAAAFAGTFLCYAELLRRSAGIAHALLALGVTADRPIGVCCERSLELPTALLGVLRAGGAFLPLDPSHPPARLALLLEELEDPTGEGGAVVVAGEDQRGVLAAAAAGRERPVRLLAAGAAAGGEGGGLPLPCLQEDQLAYVLHTSGSSGRPKGVMCTHRGIVNRLLWMQACFALAPGERVLQKTPTTFDVSVWELFWPLAVGGTLVLARPGAHLDPAEMIRTVAEEGVTTLHFVPSLLGLFLAEPGAAACRSLRRVVASGEALGSDLWRRFREVYGEGEAPGLFNLYGPTEASVDVTAHRCQPEDAAGPGSVPIGRPVANTAVHVLDEVLAPVPPGTPGELYLAGIQLARGYLGRPDLTADRFVPAPFAGAPGERLYRTGDRTRRRPDGAVEFLGRVDGQVKLRGQRVEPGEIEALLAGHPGVLEAAVAVEGESPEHRRLVACLVGRPGALRPGFEEIRGFLAARLPQGLVPGRFVWLEALPHTASGKVDRRALGDRSTAKAPTAEGLDALLARVEALSEEEVRALLAAPAGEPPARLMAAGGRR